MAYIKFFIIISYYYSLVKMKFLDSPHCPNQYEDAADFAINSMTDCTRDTRNWMISDNLMLHDDKTKFLVLGTR